MQPIGRAMDWNRVKAEFAFDGALRDIYVLGTSHAHWKAAWAALRELDPPPVLTSLGCSGPMPENLDWAAAFGETRPMLAVTVGRVALNCHFFDESEIEFDLDPRDVASRDDAEGIAQFMSILGEATGRPVILTCENVKHAVIARYDPAAARVVWLAIQP
ncbi:hypothetical protein [Methylopila sp. M107]|uniref:hypothetical protein n=1 Tax=Methylopila sp. M107 TaxID=1101190 RepID=UPI0003A0D9C4|nr:hypothetical protein [Methylopila sp. M107]